MILINPDWIDGIEADGLWSVEDGAPVCSLVARIGDKDTGQRYTLAYLDLEEVSDLIGELQALQAQMEAER